MLKLVRCAFKVPPPNFLSSSYIFRTVDVGWCWYFLRFLLLCPHPLWWLADAGLSLPVYKRRPTSPLLPIDTLPVRGVDDVAFLSLSVQRSSRSSTPLRTCRFAPRLRKISIILPLINTGGLVRLKFSKIRLDPTQKLSTMARVLIAIAIIIGAGKLHPSLSILKNI